MSSLYYNYNLLKLKKTHFRWLLYDGENYNTNNPSLTTFNGWGEGYCVDFDNSFRSSSLHLVQQNYDPRISSTINIFFADIRFLIITVNHNND